MFIRLPCSASSYAADLDKWSRPAFDVEYEKVSFPLDWKAEMLDILIMLSLSLQD